ncbi:hypothetical protein F4777DRAFT_536756 [Nemania sp. FL0916]|nr:hypothetical protein F4777DRAFT_536756 [Nemania sp. FL0916]
MSNHHLEEITSGGPGDFIELSIRWNDGRTIVTLSASPTGNATEDILITKYNAAVHAKDYEEEQVLTDQILDAIVDAGRSLFDQLAPPPTSSDSDMPSDLHSLLFPSEHAFAFRTIDDELVLLPMDRSSSSHGEEPEAQLHVIPDTKLPTFYTKDIQVLEKLLGDGYITRVLAGGREMCSKVIDDLRTEALQRELTCLLKIAASGHAGALRVPKLLGLVRNSDSGRIIGFLEDYIPFSDTEELSTLREIESVSSIAIARRKKWASQLQETVDLLHEIGVTWGHAKAANVLIHRDTDDVWVADFGAGWTKSWIDQDLNGTIDGDKMALKKILEFLEV